MNNIIMHLRHELEDNRRRLSELTKTIDELTAKLENMQTTDEHYRDIYT